MVLIGKLVRNGIKTSKSLMTLKYTAIGHLKDTQWLVTNRDAELLLRRLIRMRDDGLLAGDDVWIHVLGISVLLGVVILRQFNDN